MTIRFVYTKSSSEHVIRMKEEFSFPWLSPAGSVGLMTAKDFLLEQMDKLCQSHLISIRERKQQENVGMCVWEGRYRGEEWLTVRKKKWTHKSYLHIVQPRDEILIWLGMIKVTSYQWECIHGTPKRFPTYPLIHKCNAAPVYENRRGPTYLSKELLG